MTRRSAQALRHSQKKGEGKVDWPYLSDMPLNFSLSHRKCNGTPGGERQGISWIEPGLDCNRPPLNAFD